MRKYGFIIFVILGVGIIILGTLLLLFDKKVFVPGSLNEAPESLIWSGWVIMFVGLAMLLHGFFIKWTINRERNNNQVTIDPPPTEFIDDTNRISRKSDKSTYNIK